MQELTITKAEASQRFDKYLKRIFPQMNSGFLYKMLRKKNITLNGKKADGTELLKERDIVRCFFSEETYQKFTGVTLTADKQQLRQLQEYQTAYQTLQKITVIYEDVHIVLLNKPAGVLSQKAQKEDLSINEWLLGYLLASGGVTKESLSYFKPSVCNRLDRNTSGLVICGKTLLGSQMLSKLLKERTLHKYYHTYVYGSLEGEKTLTGYLRKDTNTNQAKLFLEKPPHSLKEYDPVTTAYRSLIAKDAFSYLEIELITGKTHQIRAHLASIGHPIVGDTKYKSKKQPLHRAADFPKTQLLHAYRIVFPVLEGEFSYLSQKEFICKEPDCFLKFAKQYF